ncbi:MAG: AI-2E family transporter, partial [Oscillospiraceae bacterium]|nr:AI-2E family transporter [Oscillospiraceae bacterium]
VDKEKFGAQARAVLAHYMKDSWYERFNYVIDVLDDSFHKFIVGQCTEAVILGLLCTGGMMLLRLPYATMIGTLLGFMALIPMVGSFIATVIGAFMIFTVSPAKALVFVIFEIVMQQIEGNFIYPKVVGSSIGLPAVLVLTAVTVGGGVFGVVGLLAGVPLTAAVYRIVSDDIKKPKKIKD